MKQVSQKIVMELKKENRRLLHLIHLKCAECNGWYADGYDTCGSECCPLRFSQPKKGFEQTKDVMDGRREAFSH